MCEDAYLLGVPDGPVTLLAYSATMLLASAVENESSRKRTFIDAALGATVMANAAGALFYLNNMIFKHNKICLYCVTGAAINIASAAIVVPVVLKSLKKFSLE